MRIYPSITTTSKANWQEQIQEATKIGLEEVCFFPTAVDSSVRKKICKQLEKSSIKKIPLVHLRTDINIDEMEYFMEKYHTRLFNIHAQCRHRLVHDLSKYKDIIYIENQFDKFEDNELGIFAGLCLDISHLEQARIMELDIYQYFLDKLNKYKCGCGHISKINEKELGGHCFESLQEFDYIKKYTKYLPEVLALELENSIFDQMKAKDYIENLLGIDK